MKVANEFATRVEVTPGAVALIERLVAKHGPVMFHQSGGGGGGAGPAGWSRGGR